MGQFQAYELMNTTDRFRYFSEQAAKQSTLHKPSGLQGMTVDFFTHPSLVGPVTFQGIWRVQVFANSSASSPVAFTIRFRELSTRDGTQSWDSGTLTPTVDSAIGSDLDGTVYLYTLSTMTALTHSFAPSSTIQVSVSVYLPDTTMEARIWYDSPFYPSRAVLPALDRAMPSGIWTEDTTGSLAKLFPAEPGVIVLVSVNVTSPFGGYDINATGSGSKDARVTLTVTGPDGSILVYPQRMTLISGGPLAFSNVLRYDLTLPAFRGDYLVTVYVKDNSGNSEQGAFSFGLGRLYRAVMRMVDEKSKPLPGALLTGLVDGVEVFRATADRDGIVDRPIIEASYLLRVTWQGVTVYESQHTIASDVVLGLASRVYDPIILVVDDAGLPVSGASASVTHPNGTLLSAITGTGGGLSLSRLPSGEIRVVVSWRIATIFDGTVQIDSDGPYVVKTSVYLLTVTVKDESGGAVPSAYVALYDDDDSVTSLEVTDAIGAVTLRVPAGIYRIQAFSSAADQSAAAMPTLAESWVRVSSSQSVNLTLPYLPPAEQSTSAFLGVLAATAAALALTLVTYLVVRKRFLRPSRAVGGPVLSTSP